MDLKDIKKIAILGAGTMGSGLAQIHAQAGYQVTMYSRSKGTLDKAVALIKSSLQTEVDEGLQDGDQVPAILERITTTTSVEEGAKEADIAVETIVENVAEKKKLCSQLDELCPPHTIIASNTSFLNIFEVAEISRSDKLISAHWYMPPQLIPLVEVVKGPKTSDETVSLIVEMLKKMGKKPAVMKKYIPGFVINRFQVALQREVYYLIDNGYMDPAEIDEAARWGLALRMLVLGILQRMDFGGLDITVRNLKNPDTHPVPDDFTPTRVFELFDKGYLGVKAGKGWFDYSAKSQAEWNRDRDRGLIKLLKALNLR